MMKTKVLYLAVRTALLLSLFCLLNPGWVASVDGADPAIVKWDNSGGGPHDVYHMYSVTDTGIWNTTLDSYGATRVYTNETFSAAYFEDVTAAIIPMPNREAGYTAAEATAIKDFVDDGGRVLLCGYYDKKYWNPASTNMVAAKWGVEYVLTDGTYNDTRYCQVRETSGNYYGEYDNSIKVKDFEDHMITEGVTEYYARGGSLDVSGSKAKVLARGSSTAFYDLNDTAGTWINGSEIIYMAVIENDNGGGIIFSYTPYILRHEYTFLHGDQYGYNGSKLPDNISKWLVEGFPEEEDSPGFEAIMVLLILVPLAIPVLRRRR